MFYVLIAIGLLIIIVGLAVSRKTQAASVSETYQRPSNASEAPASREESQKHTSGPNASETYQDPLSVSETSTPESLEVSSLAVKGKVIVKQIVGRKIIERECKLNDDGTIHCGRNLIFTIPEQYEPFIVFRGGLRKKAYLAFLYDEHGNAIEVKKNGEAEAKSPDPRITASIFNSRILTQVFRKLYVDPLTSLTFLIGGMGIMALIIFFVLPALGIPVQLGNRPIAVQVKIPMYNASLPPAGNYTPSLPGG